MDELQKALDKSRILETAKLAGILADNLNSETWEIVLTNAPRVYLIEDSETGIITSINLYPFFGSHVGFDVAKNILVHSSSNGERILKHLIRKEILSLFKDLSYYLNENTKLYPTPRRTMSFPIHRNDDKGYGSSDEKVVMKTFYIDLYDIFEMRVGFNKEVNVLIMSSKY